MVTAANPCAAGAMNEAQMELLRQRFLEMPPGERFMFGPPARPIVMDSLEHP